MKRSSKLGAVGLVAALVAGAAGTVAAAAPDPGFETSRPAQLVALEAGVQIEPILSVGDVLGDYQMSGIPDGLGAYKEKGNLRVLMNHELSGSAPAGVGARVSLLTLDRNTLGVLDASHVVDGTEGYSRLCSSSLAVIEGTPWYFTGEESTATGALTPDPGDGIGRGGVSVAIDAETGQVIETPHFGHLEFENVVPVERLKVAMVLAAEDGDAGKSQLYAYTAKTFDDAIAGNGQLWVWTTTKTVDDPNPSTDDIVKGETIPGEFVPISQTDNDSAAELEAAAQAAGAFDFVRMEDAAVGRRGPGTVYFADTGAAGAESVKGRLYRLDVDPSDPAKASLTLLLDGDAGDDLVNPDNLDTSEHSVVITEDRNAEHRGAEVAGGYGRVLVYDIRTGSVRVVARVDTSSGLKPGEWEASGILNAGTLLGKDWWLVDVQGHKASAPQPGLDLVPGSSVGEDGQLLAIRIPGS